jgi:hypothetical protein
MIPMTTSSNVQKILTALDLESLKPAEQDEILYDLNDLVFKSTLIRLLEQMDNRLRSSFESMLDEGASDEELRDFIQAHLPEAEAVFNQTLGELADDILAVTQK